MKNRTKNKLTQKQPLTCFEKVKWVFLAILNLLTFNYYSFKTSNQRYDSIKTEVFNGAQKNLSKCRKDISDAIKDFSVGESKLFLEYLNRHEVPTLEERLNRIRISPLPRIAFLSPEVIQQYKEHFIPK